jgi:hypothetical protein
MTVLNNRSSAACEIQIKAGQSIMNIPDNISAIATIISKDWKKVNYAARPYLDAMFSLQSINDNYANDSARSIINYFLHNASSWRGETAKAVKQKLKELGNA